MSKLEIKEGQTYVCKRDDLEWWTEGKEYKVQKFCNGIFYLKNDEGYNWYMPNNELLNDVFKLKEQPFDLNKLTTAQLKEYIGLLEKDLKVVEEEFKKQQNHYNTILKQLEEWK